MRYNRKRDSVEAEIVRALVDLHCIVLVNESGKYAGYPDLTVITLSGQTIYVEVKSPGGRVSDAQATLLDELRARGCTAIVAYSIDDVLAAMSQ